MSISLRVEIAQPCPLVYRPALCGHHLLRASYGADCHHVATQDLIDKLDRDLTYAIEVEGKMRLADVSNYDAVRRPGYFGSSCSTGRDSLVALQPWVRGLQLALGSG